MKFGKVLTYKDIEEAKKLIGKKVVASDNLKRIENPEHVSIRELSFISDSNTSPFVVKNSTLFQFIREVIEEPQR